MLHILQGEIPILPLQSWWDKSWFIECKL